MLKTLYNYSFCVLKSTLEIKANRQGYQTCMWFYTDIYSDSTFNSNVQAAGIGICMLEYEVSDSVYYRWVKMFWMSCHITSFNTLIICCFLLQQQLGYLVSSGIRRGTSSQGFEVSVQSDHRPGKIDENIEYFLLVVGVSKSIWV